jgi:hypothetical protein
MASRARQMKNEKRNAHPKTEKFHIFQVGDRVKLNREKERLQYSRYQTMLSYYGTSPLTVVEVTQRDDNGPDDHPQKIRVQANGLYEEADWFLPMR